MNTPTAPAGQAHGRTLADAGMAAALNHAERVAPAWGEVAFSAFKRYARSLPSGARFQCEDVRRWAMAEGLVDEPPSLRAWGPITKRAIRAGVVRHVGFASVDNPAAHCAPTAVYEVGTGAFALEPAGGGVE